METKDILLQYGTHFDAIKKIGGYPLTNSLQLSDLGKIKEMKAICLGFVSGDDIPDVVEENSVEFAPFLTSPTFQKKRIQIGKKALKMMINHIFLGM